MPSYTEKIVKQQKMEKPEKPVKSRKISILEELNYNDKSTFYLPRQVSCTITHTFVNWGIVGQNMAGNLKITTI